MASHTPWTLLVWCLIAQYLVAGNASALAVPSSTQEERPYALVLPSASSSKLDLAEDGLALLESITDPVAPIVVIGPYRSGKSFLLNQLLGVPCDKGFGVGHTRDTQTKGVWVWGRPQTKKDAPPGSRVQLLYVDTEGFESTGRANSYDDRVFALSAIVSSLLIYNLPETIRGSDIAKLSFAVDIAQGFYDSGGDEGAGGGGGAGEQQRAGGGDAAGAPSGGPLEPSNMLWLIQRDFLQGKSVQQLVNEALSPVPNPGRDAELDQLNRIRASLQTIARNSTGYSLPQPHLRRTALCELNDTQLDAAYVERRDGLKELVQQLANAKVVAGKLYTGRELAQLVRRMVKALNAKEIPSAAALIESFNNELLTRSLAVYVSRVEALQLPVDEARFAAVAAEAEAAALVQFREQLLGRRQADTLRTSLLAAMARERGIRATANVAESNARCQQHEMECERLLDTAQRAALPSMRQFDSSYSHCEGRFAVACVGPARNASSERLTRSWSNARARFAAQYNDRLYARLLVCSIIAVVVFRFAVKVKILEAGGWAAFVFLELYPRLYPGAGGMYEAGWWLLAARIWEAVIVTLFGFAGAPVVWCVALVGGYAAWWVIVRRHARRNKRHKLTPDAPLRDLDV